MARAISCTIFYFYGILTLLGFSNTTKCLFLGDTMTFNRFCELISNFMLGLKCASQRIMSRLTDGLLLYQSYHGVDMLGMKTFVALWEASNLLMKSLHDYLLLCAAVVKCRFAMLLGPFNLFLKCSCAFNQQCSCCTTLILSIRPRRYNVVAVVTSALLLSIYVVNWIWNGVQLVDSLYFKVYFADLGLSRRHL